MGVDRLDETGAASARGREGISKRSREDMIDAAIQAFAAKGFQGTTTREVAAAAGLTPASFYVHFKSKEDLLYEIARTGHHQVLVSSRDSLNPEDDPTQQLVSFMRSFVIWHTTQHARARVNNYELKSLADDHYREVLELRRETQQFVMSLLQRGIDEDLFDCPQPWLTTFAILSLGIDVARWYPESHRWPPEEIAERYGRLVLKMVGAREALIT